MLSLCQDTVLPRLCQVKAFHPSVNSSFQSGCPWTLTFILQIICAIFLGGGGRVEGAGQLVLPAGPEVLRGRMKGDPPAAKFKEGTVPVALMGCQGLHQWP